MTTSGRKGHLPLMASEDARAVYRDISIDIFQLGVFADTIDEEMGGGIEEQAAYRNSYILV